MKCTLLGLNLNLNYPVGFHYYYLFIVIADFSICFVCCSSIFAKICSLGMNSGAEAVILRDDNLRARLNKIHFRWKGCSCWCFNFSFNHIRIEESTRVLCGVSIYNWWFLMWSSNDGLSIITNNFCISSFNSCICSNNTAFLS